jgi:integrase
MSTTYKVRIWKLETRKNKQGKVTSYRVRWEVDGSRFAEPFTTFALADSFRSKLMTAAKDGEAFDTQTGLPATLQRQSDSMNFFDFACAYMDMKWPDSSPKYRKSLTESLVSVTVPLLDQKRTLPEPKLLRKALMTAFNTRARERDHSTELTQAIKLAQKAAVDVGKLAEPETLRKVLRALELKLDGNRASLNTIRHRRTTLGNAIEFALEKRLLATNPMKEVKTVKKKYNLREVDPRSVVNPMQGRMLIDAVHQPHLKAFFGSMYYGALRPEEVNSLRKGDLVLPPPALDKETGESKYGWGDIHLGRARPEVGEEWTDSGTADEERGLKHREDGVGRTVPSPPQLTELLLKHMDQFGTAADGRLFRSARTGRRIGSSVYGRAWAVARNEVFTTEVAAGPLGKEPYSLRHAAVSTYLNLGVEATRVAKWAGHSLAVLLRVYAKCLDGGEQAARDRVARGLWGG